FSRDWSSDVCSSDLPQPLGHFTGDVAAMAVVGVAGKEIPLRNAMEREQKLVAAAVRLPVPTHAVGQRVEQGGLAVVVGDEAQLRSEVRRVGKVGASR